MAKKREKRTEVPVFLGIRKAQVGKFAGVEIPGFALVSTKFLKDSGMQGTGFPAKVGTSSYAIENGEIVATGKRGNKDTKRTVAIGHGTKPLKVYLKSSVDKTVKIHGKAAKTTVRKSFTIGVPAWFTVPLARKFLSKGGNIASFSFGGGTYPAVLDRTGGK
jgi:hypothetical protein